ncbi:hypothetical protein CC80DRAFT_596130 [Byssothecium circinans]|uniref:BTB domain-containing protein n=1 Tax=Byssothecium circinans TaxID=147558 RepID=A0A6A5TL99_9PLEO|nr:hypothetical protein CC80DRAFT_596130 [Byssothecium circinans]
MSTPPFSGHAPANSHHDSGYDEEWPRNAEPSSSSRVSLFSPNEPAIVGEASAARVGDAPVPVHAGSPPPNSSRPLQTLANIASMKRNSRLKVSDEQPSPIAQFTPRIPSAQKDADDPTTPPDSRRSRESQGRDYTTLTTLSRLFAGDATMTNSRTPSYNQASGPLYTRASNESIPLPDHLYSRGLLEGRHSDITIIAFGRRYALHRLLLDRAPFFTSALSEPWLESQSKEVPLYPEDIDSNITQPAFELAIKKLYGVDISKECDAEAIGLFATGCWLEMQDLIDSSIESILRQMTPYLLAPLIRLVTSNYYGRSGDRILESAKAMLSRNGWEMPLKYWDDMPGDVIRELVASDGFYVDSEWDRWVLAKRLLDRRLRQAAIEAGLIQRGQRPIPKAPNSLSLMAIRFDGVYRQNALTTQQPASDAQSDWLALYTNPDIERILVLLDEGIHYIHLDYEQLEFIRNARDVFGLPVMPDRVISNALWQQLALRQKVLNADDSAQELGLCKNPPEPAPANAGTKTEGTSSFKGKQKAPARLERDDSDMQSGSWDANGKPRKFWIPSSDCNIVLGNGTDPVITTSSSFQRHATRLSATLQPEDAQWATDFASSPSTMANPNTRADPGRPISAGGGNAGQPKPIAYTDFPPFRFSAEFPNPRFLKEKKRVYSRTVSYAGSLWNIYIQKVRSAKNVQLGVYLHRAKERDTEEPNHSNNLSQQNAGSVDERIGQLEREMLLRSERRERRRSGRAVPVEHNEEDTSGSGGDPDSTLISTNSRNNPLFSSPSLSSRRSGTIPRLNPVRGNTPFQLPILSPPSGPDFDGPADSPFFPLTIDAATDDEFDESDAEDEPTSSYPNPSLSAQRRSHASMSTLPSYVDARPTIKTYFKIYSPSKGGRMLSIYESAPDRFNFSQSWGWKSSTLMLDEGALTGFEDGAGAEGVVRKKGDGMLRFMVVIGNL